VSRYLSVLLVIAAAAAALAQQADEAIIVGSVQDETGAAVAGAVVTARHAATGAETQAVTDGRGQYRTPPVRSGTYDITVEAPGFKRADQHNMVLNIGDVREVDVKLAIGQVNETVDVEAAAPLLQTADATVGTVIANRQIEDLPLNGRDYLQLAALSAGTIPTVNNGVGISIGGQAGSQAAFLLDGADNNNQQITTGHSGQKEIIKPSVDAIQEFKVVTNGYSAEYGRSSSGVISVAIKSGTNQFHGVGYEFLRNEAIDAKNLFATYKSPFKRNQFGGAIGGPIVKDKTFFFFDYEAGIIRQSTTVVSTVPTLAERQGIFPVTIYDPATYQSGSRTPFLGNQIPLSRMDPAALRILNYYPLPQTSAATSNYVYASPLNQDPRRWDARADQILDSKRNLYFRYSSQTQNDQVSSPFPPTSQGYYSSATVSEAGAQHTNSQSFVLGLNQVVSSNVVGSIRAGWNNLFWYNFFPNQPLTGVGIPGVNQSYPGFTSIAITGYQGLGVTNVPNTDDSQNRQLTGDLTWNKGKHNLKFGVQAYWLQTNFLSSQQISGIFNFNGQYTRNATTLAGGSPLADFLLGDASSASLSNWAYLEFRTPYTHFFVQDDWKVSRRLTLSLGLRYELSPPAVEKNNRIANFDLDSDPGHPQLILAGAGGSSRADEALQGVNYHQLAPRFGFAYSLPGDKTVIRGGYGWFYSNMITLGGMQSMEINPPNHLRVNLSTNPSVPSIFVDQGFPATTLSPANAQNVELVSYDRRAVTPLAQEWNINIQRQLPGGVLVEIGYYGNKLDHMWRQIDGNPAPPGPGNINSRRLYTSTAVPGTPYSITLADVVRIQKDGYSDYNGLQAKAEKRYSNGLTFLAAYSWSKTIALGDTSGVQNPLDWAADRAVSSQDMTQHFVGSAVYELPFGRGKPLGSHWSHLTNAVLGGWSLGPIVTVDTGMPLNLTVAGTPSNSGQQDRPNVVGNWRLSDPTVREWFNTAAFVPNAPYTYGNAGRNVLRGPGVFNLDLAAHKSFRITERVTAQLRLESFNLTNTPALGAPNTQVGNVAFGQISSAGTPRDNQAALKIYF